METTHVRFEHRPAGEPALGLGTATPRLSWRVDGAPDGFVQAHAEAEVTRTPWGGPASTDVVTLAGDAQVLVDWPVAPLAARERAEVRVRVTGADGAASEWSAPAVVEAGLLEVADWGEARFVSPSTLGAIGAPAPALVAALEVPGGVRDARLHITAHGWYEVHLNGARVGEDYFGPGWTAYEKRLRTYTYDVTALLRSGANDVAILLGEGWWRSPITWTMIRGLYGDRLAALARLEVVTDAGEQLVLATDGTWRAAETNIDENTLYGGESVDLRRPVVGEASDGVDVLDASLEVLVAAEGPAVRVTDVLGAQRVWRSPSGALLVDFGQNVVGFTRLRVRGLAAGAKVVVRHAEVLEHDELGVRPLRNAKATDTYVVAGPDAAVLEPRFTFHGFRYAEVSGVDDLDAGDIDAVVTGSALTRTGWFECSEPLVNQLHSNVVWGMKGNFVDVPTDCPQRDERLGWTGDIQVFSPSALFLHDAVGFLGNWAADLAAEQASDGTVPIVVPNALRDGMGAMPAAAWGDAATVVPWNVYALSGDVEVLRRQVGSMKAWVDKVDSIATGDLWLGGFQFGDWLDPDAAPDNPADAKADPDIVASACFYHSADLTARACAVLGDEAGAVKYRRLAEAIKAAFQRAFVTPAGRMLSDSATVYAQAIVWGLLSEEQTAFAGARLADLARLASFRVSTGFVGTPLICDALSLTGHTDVAYGLLLERGCPSWLYPVTMGATTIWERWDSMLPDGTINPGEMTSFNHYALGAVADWMHRVVAGLAFDPLTRVITVAPEPGGTLTHARARLETPYGSAESSWRREGSSVVVDAVVPAGLTGHVVLPDGQTFAVASGRHSWTVEVPVAGGHPGTVRELISSPYWKDVAKVVTAKTPFGDDLALAKRMARTLDAPVAALGMAATMGGMMGPADEVQADVDAVLAG